MSLSLSFTHNDTLTHPNTHLLDSAAEAHTHRQALRRQEQWAEANLGGRRSTIPAADGMRRGGIGMASGYTS